MLSSDAILRNFRRVLLASCPLTRRRRSITSRRSFLQGSGRLTASFKNVAPKISTTARASGAESTESWVEKMLETMSSRSEKDLEIVKEFDVAQRKKLTASGLCCGQRCVLTARPMSCVCCNDYL
eukprot:EC120919.1.p1 GENE.EC120919.1~~EC120919.1.p1  ORF type:complete len:125 (+),score=13.92 EC120919.1:199-573(+)